MSLPTIEPLPDENETLPPARRRRQRRTILPQDLSERGELLREIARRVVPSFDFFLFSLLSGLALGIAMLLDAPALFMLAALLSPFMAPVMGICVGTVAGTGRFILQSLGSLGIGSLIVFLCGAASGWAVTLLPEREYLQAAQYSHFNVPFFVVLVVGAALTCYLMVRAPLSKPLVSSVAIAYGLYLPVGAAGFGLTSGIAGLWPDGLALFLIHLAWAAFIGILILALLGLRPINPSGSLLGAAYGLAGVALLFLAAGGLPQFNLPRNGALPAVFGKTSAEATPTPPAASTPIPPSTPTAPPTSSATLAPTPTRSLVPTRTATITITPAPTPVWARINASQGGGALVREEPKYTGTVVQSVLNDTLVEVLPDVTNSEGVAWVHIRLINGKEGWVVRSLLRTATPAPNW
jgi:hypothetical protein